jgi:hypothetical protein
MLPACVVVLDVAFGIFLENSRPYVYRISQKKQKKQQQEE